VDKAQLNGSAEEMDHEMACTLFHVTRSESASTILRDGFIDGRGNYLTDREFTGVWLSDRPLWDENEADRDDTSITILAVKFSVPLSELDQYEWIEEGKSYREWLVPAAVIRQLASVSKLEN
jgi:hypothetical protein